jgi:hypothetical protein
MIGSKGDLKQGILGALTAGFMHPMKAHPAISKLTATQLSGNPANHIRSDNILCSLCPCPMA